MSDILEKSDLNLPPATSTAAVVLPLAGMPVTPVLRIEPSRGWVALKLDELWEYRELLYFLTWRDIKVRYAQTMLGCAWAVLQPLFMMVVFSVFFGRLGGLDKLVEGVPYRVWTLAALIPWTFFANGLTNSSNSLVGSGNLIKKVYFPRLAIPISSILAGFVDFCVGFLLLLGVMASHRLLPTMNIVFLPLFLVLGVITSLGVGLWFTALNVQYRDVRYVVPFLIQVWMFATPVAIPASRMLEKYGPTWQTLYGLNPMVGVIEGFRWALLGGANPPPGPMVWVSVLTSVVLLISGAFYFRRMEKRFADLV